jgi:hypothetical protein
LLSTRAANRPQRRLATHKPQPRRVPDAPTPERSITVGCRQRSHAPTPEGVLITRRVPSAQRRTHAREILIAHRMPSAQPRTHAREIDMPPAQRRTHAKNDPLSSKNTYPEESCRAKALNLNRLQQPGEIKLRFVHRCALNFPAQRLQHPHHILLGMEIGSRRFARAGKKAPNFF